ncbi:MAG: hypothetical protein RL497_896 [Pseudomonadota bacterium]|jgi:type III pantothenate kinase
MNVLDIDLGNSRAKWRIATLGLSGSWLRLDATDSKAYPAEWQAINRSVSAIRLASVRSDQDTEAVIDALHKRFACDIHRAYSCGEAAGVINGYAEPQRLGVDRWLALLAARQVMQGDVVVVDAGTAITLDLLTGQGQHLGGYILPGVVRQAESLGVTRVQVVSAQLQPQWMPGQATQECVSAAITASILGLCCRAQHHLPAAHWCLTGGDVNWLAAICNELNLRFTQYPNLVLDGLAWCPMQTYPAP